VTSRASDARSSREWSSTMLTIAIPVPSAWQYDTRRAKQGPEVPSWSSPSVKASLTNCRTLRVI
jgi:hypothetical protein